MSKILFVFASYVISGSVAGIEDLKHFLEKVFFFSANSFAKGRQRINLLLLFVIKADFSA